MIMPIASKLKFIMVLLLSAAALFLHAPSPNVLAAVDCNSGDLTAQQAIQCGVGGASGNNTVPTTKQSTDSFNRIIKTFLNLLSVGVGIAAVVMIILGGLRFIASGGNAEKVKSARSALMYAVIGLAIVALSQAIVQFALDKVG